MTSRTRNRTVKSISRELYGRLEIRRGGHRHRPGRLCLRHPRRPARPQDRRGGEAARPTAAPASMSAASRPRRCCTPPSCSRRPGTRSRSMGIKVGTPKLDLAAMMAHKDEARRRQRQGRRVPVQEEQDRRHSRGRPHRRGRQGRGHGERRRDADDRGQEHRDRHRLGRGAAARASTSTRSASCPPPARSRSTRCRSGCSSSAPA